MKIQWEQWIHLNEKLTPGTTYFTLKKAAVATENSVFKKEFYKVFELDLIQHF